MRKLKGKTAEKSNSLAEDIKGYLKKGKKMRKNKKHPEALENFSRAIELDSNCAEAYLNRAIVYQNINQHRNALEDFNKAIQLDPDNDHAYLHRALSYKILEDYDKSLNDLDRTMELNAKSRLVCLYNKGNVYASAGQRDKALEAFSEAISLKPNDAESYMRRGSMYAVMREYDKASTDLDKAVELDPKNANCYCGRGILHAYMHKDDKALADFDKAVEIRPEDPVILLNKSIFHLRLKQLDKALEIVEKTIQLDPEFALGHFHRGLIYEQLRQVDKALEDYRRAVKLDPDNSHFYVHVGIVYGNLYLFDKAFDFLNKAIKINPKDFWAYLNRGIGYLDLGKHNTALKDFDIALKLSPKAAYTHFERGKALCYLINEKKTFAELKTHRRKIVASFKRALETAGEDENLIKLSKWWLDFSRIYCDASVENRKRLRIFAELYEDALESDFFSKVFTEKNRLSIFMSATKTLDKSECHFDVLRRWNSFTPIIPGKVRSNLGGGYFLAWEGSGSVIDPGYNYIENFIDSGRSLGDVKNIIITHAHDDHTADFEALLSLFSKMGKHERLNLFVNLGSQVKFSNLISKNEPEIDKVEILNDNQVYEISKDVKMKATRAMHRDILTEMTSKGLIFQMKRPSRTYALGITGDTKFYFRTAEKKEKSLCDFFENIDVLVLHMGSMHEDEFELTSDNFVGHQYQGEHLGIRGIMNMIFQCRPKLAIISEFGEELKHMRISIARWIDNTFDNYDSSNKVRVIPGDVGLRIVFEDSIKIRCEVCGKLIELEDIDYAETSINDKIAYCCKNHKREDVVSKFKEEEEEEIRARVKSVGCMLDLTPLTETSRMKTT